MNDVFFHKLSKDASQLERLIAKTRKSPKPDNVHDLRVQTRRSRARLWLLKDALPGKQLKPIRKELKQIGRALGERRKWDVAKEDAQHYGLALKGKQREQKDANKSLKRVLGGCKKKNLKQNFEKIAQLAEEKVSKSDLERRVNGLKKYLEKNIRRIPESAESRHALRIQVKKARYLLENFHCPTEGLKKLQDCLGREHDLETLEKLIRGTSADIQRDKANAKRRANAILVTTLRAAVRDLAKIH